MQVFCVRASAETDVFFVEISIINNVSILYECIFDIS